MIHQPLTPQQQRQRVLAARLRACGILHPSLTIETVAGVVQKRVLDTADFESTNLTDLLLDMFELSASAVERRSGP